MALTDLQLQHASFDLWVSSEGEDNNVDLDKLKSVLPIVLNECVTVMQKTYMMHHFVDGLSVTEIAKMYGVNKSTVSRVIHSGLNNAYKYLRFVSLLFINVPQRRLHLGEGRKHRRMDGD
jgi:predicted DNA-binding protein YlxM (UPF0122 family)